MWSLFPFRLMCRADVRAARSPFWATITFGRLEPSSEVMVLARLLLLAVVHSARGIDIEMPKQLLKASEGAARQLSATGPVMVFVRTLYYLRAVEH